MPNPLAQVLAVEDSPHFASLLQSVLQLIGAELTIASSGEQAMELVRQRRFDLIILNVRLPGINGLEVCRRLKQDPELKTIPVIFSSGEPDSHIRDEAVCLGAVDYLVKPYRMQDFMARVLPCLPHAHRAGVGRDSQPPDKV